MAIKGKAGNATSPVAKKKKTTKKKTAMAKQVEADEKVAKGQTPETIEPEEDVVEEQLDLFEHLPAEAKELSKLIGIYEAAKSKRMKALDKEVEMKQQILDKVQSLGLKPNAKGKISFVCEGFKIEATPSSWTLKIKDE